MPSSLFQMPSPYSPIKREREDSIPMDQSSNEPTSKMLKIDSLLNPPMAAHNSAYHPADSPPPTPAFAQSASALSTPASRTAFTPSPGRQKLVKDNAIFVRGVPKEPVKYLPFECTEDSVCLSDREKDELSVQHERFAIFPSGRGDQGFISDYQRHIPYASEKKTFYGKTNRDAFEVFQYTFRIPDDPDNREYVVMWDYQVGLVRITPFFKALKYSKTTPAKALNCNPGLKDLSHSITGGALAAQGYWMPYSCARAVCLTFCYPIRWALTPIFGPSFIKECLRPENGNFGRFKIPAEVIYNARLEADGMRSDDGSRDGTPMNGYDYTSGVNPEIPRSVPPPPVTHKPLRPRTPKTGFKLGSPFASASEASASDIAYDADAYDSPGLSPKTSHTAYSSPGWTCINHHEPTPPLPSNAAVSPRQRLLPAESSVLPTTSWRALDPAVSSPGQSTPALPKSVNTDRRPGNKRRISATLSNGEDTSYSADVSHNDSSESGDDAVLSPAAKKRARGDNIAATGTSSKNVRDTSDRGVGPRAKHHAADYRAAQWLLSLSVRDSQLAKGPKVMEGIERRGSEV
ncbi:APSES transcription factor Xbp1 like protein [Teratosphaeria destructans]|uniref:APSES transcription factor Xbp1 like protein n=1 Tax=Teratosphaeria destructans TaxID=418781 RepID=A0A9W7W7X7_9PEZI|nr:APSES transcription factor Xbp1 like protein [Teratosphaeria destructans]